MSVGRVILTPPSSDAREISRKIARGGSRRCGPAFAPVAVIMDFNALVNRVRGEFLEMPGLRLTLEQARRLWGVDATACQAVVDALVQASFLRRTSAGTIGRLDG